MNKQLFINKEDMKQLAEKAQKTFEASIRMLMTEKGKSFSRSASYSA